MAHRKIISQMAKVNGSIFRMLALAHLEFATYALGSATVNVTLGAREALRRFGACRVILSK